MTINKHLPFNISFFFILLLLASCERSGYYDDSEQGIINDFCNKNWIREYESYYNGTKYEIQEIYNFKTDGTYSRKFQRIDNEGNINNGENHYEWSFTTPQFNHVFLGWGNACWKIRALTSTKLSVMEYYGDYNNVSSHGDYYEFTAESK